MDEYLHYILQQFSARRPLATLVLIMLMLVPLSALADDDDDNVKLQVGYVNKQWVSDINGTTHRENLWGHENRFLHGMQVGFVYTPSLNKFVGLHTGLFFEGYFSQSSDMGYDDFEESSLYLPAHVNVNLSLSPTVAIVVQGGLGLNYAIHGGFSNHDSWYWDYDSDGYPYRHQYELDHIRYGRLGWPKRFNAQAEVSVGVKVKHVVVSALYGWGLNDHHLYKTIRGSSTHQNKMALTVGFGF